MKTECIVCGYIKIFDGEGRIIDGGWESDKKIKKIYRGKWVCCYLCYQKLFKKGEKIGILKKERQWKI